MQFQLPCKQTVFLYTVACIVNLLPFFITVAFSWTSPTIPRLNGSKDPDNNPLGTTITTSQVSLLGSLFSIGSIFGPFLSMAIVPKFGRKIAIMFFTVLVTICFLIYAFATTIETYYVGRFIGGLSGGAMYVLVPIFVAEMADDNHRGRLGSLMGLLIACGSLYTYTIGTFLSIKWFSLSGLIGPIVLIGSCLTFIPETPYYWILRNNDEEAAKVLEKVRTGCTIKEEIDKIKNIMKVSKETGQGKLIDLLRTRAARKSIYLFTGIVVLQQFSGVFAIQLYLESIFREADSSISPEFSSILIGCVHMLSLSVPLTIVDCLGRRVLLILSGIGIFLSHACLGTYFYLNKQNYDLNQFNWIPIFSLIIFVVSYHSGMGVVPYVLMGEIFPETIKSLASIVIITAGCILSSTVLFIFPLLVDSIGIEYCFWIFSTSGILTAFFSYLYLPETKGKTLLEIQKIMEE